MALPVSNTFSRFKSEAAIRTGKYSNIRIKQMAGNMNPELKWQNVSTAVATNIVAGGWGGQNTSALQHFSSTCYYFGESLTDELGSGPAKAPAIGLIHTAWGGSMIEQWLSQATVNSCVRSCSNATSCGVSEWWNTRVLPFAGMTVKGWVWCKSLSLPPLLPLLLSVFKLPRLSQFTLHHLCCCRCCCLHPQTRGRTICMASLATLSRNRATPA
jgi:hypothetical protein